MLEINGTSGQTRLITLLGNPTGYSLSPAIHNLSFQLLGINAEYRAFDVDNEALGEIVDELRAADRWDGGNVTMPCKQAIIEYLDGLDEAADLIGAVNVLKKTDGKVVGYNTDGLGVQSLCKLRSTVWRISTCSHVRAVKAAASLKSWPIACAHTQRAKSSCTT